MAPTAGMRLRMKKAQSKKPQHTKKLPSLKNRIRALERFLKRGGLDDATRRAKKAELKQLQAEHEKKQEIELAKKNIEKYKKPRFFERVKLMRKLRHVKNQLEQVGATNYLSSLEFNCIRDTHRSIIKSTQATDKGEKAKYTQEFETFQQQMMYIYYYPKTEPYISLFPSKPHDEEKQKRQRELQAAAITRFEEEQPIEVFHKFCFNDGVLESTGTPAVSSSTSAAALLLKKPSKEMLKKNQKSRNRRDKTAEKPRQVALVDQDEPNEIIENKEEEEEEEQDDFFL